MPIKKLSDAVISRIAAGEVITSPSNVLKELLENSLDASSSTITIAIDSSACDISVRDDGTGIAKDDLEFLCMNHYTSKIQSTEDLKKHGTISSDASFGFRGEALHSIALCSKLKVQTRTNHSTIGYEASYSSEKLSELKECVFDEHGTFIEISNIFYNNPLRLEHFTGNKTELAKCMGIVASYGIIFNSVECKVNGKTMLRKDSNSRELLIGNTQLTNSIENIMENRRKYILQNILCSRGQYCKNEHLKAIYKGTNSSQNRFVLIYSSINADLKSSNFVFFVNKRLVRIESLKNKILQKYRKIKKGCNPFVFVEMLVENVDVNVHPSKTEVLVGDEDIFSEILQVLDEQSATKLELSEIKDDNIGKILQICTSQASSPLKVYSSPYIKGLHESLSKRVSLPRKYSLISLKSLRDELKELDPGFFKSLVFVGKFENSVYAQHQANLMKIDKKPFLRNVFYQKILRDFGNFESVEYTGKEVVKVDKELWNLLREYFGVHIEDNRVVAVPNLHDVHATGNFSGFSIEKTDEIGTIQRIAKEIAEIYSKIEMDGKLFNKIKMETLATREIIDTLSLVTDLKDLYKTFDRC